MIRIHVICEGQTEELFINAVVAPALLKSQRILIPSLIGRPGQKGGGVKFSRLFIDLRNRLLGDTSSLCTTFVDYYALPSGFPGKKDVTPGMTAKQKSDCICNGLADEVGKQLGEGSLRRFIPYVQMYEFEGLLFSCPEAFRILPGQQDLLSRLQLIRDEFESPEAINDNAQTAPSKRLLNLLDGYEKPFHGALVALEMGLPVIRGECQIFDSWLRRLESLT
jgi:hypothetical protein